MNQIVVFEMDSRSLEAKKKNSTPQVLCKWLYFFWGGRVEFTQNPQL